MLVATAFTAADLVTQPRFEPGALVVIAALAAAYGIGVRRVIGGGGRWPAARSGAFAVAVVLLLVATSSGLASVGRTDLTVHAVADMILLVVAPVFLVLSGPLGLARQVATEGTRTRIEAALSSRAVRVLTHPVTTWIPFGAALFVLYFTSLLATSVHHAAVAQLVSLGLLSFGVLFVWPVLNPDPAPGRVAPFVGMVDLLLLLPYFTLYGMAVESQTTPALAGTTVADLHNAGGAVWTMGGVGSIVLTLYVLALWLRLEERHAAPRQTLDPVGVAQLEAWRVQVARRQAAEAGVAPELARPGGGTDRPASS